MLQFAGMKRRTMAGLVCLVLAILFGMIGVADAFYLLSGLLFLLSIGLFLSNLAIWDRFKLPDVGKLFRKRRGEWDPQTGQFK